MPTLTWPEIDALPVVPYYDYDKIWSEPKHLGGTYKAGARSLIHTGDVLVCYGETRGWAKAKHPIQWRIQRRSGYLETHVGFVWKSAMGRFLIEASAARGAHLTSLSGLIPGLDDGKVHVARQDSHLFVMRPKYSVSGAWSCADAQADYARQAVAEALRYEGTSYTKLGLVNLAIAQTLGYTINTAHLMFCSRLVRMGLEKAGVNVPKTFAGIASPGDIASVCEHPNWKPLCLWHPVR